MGQSDKVILVVDDDPALLAACAESLMLDGYLVDIAESGEKALEMFPKKHYHMVITDLMMAQVDGLGVLRQVKQAAPECEVILLTAYGQVDTAVEAMKLGAYDYLTKPFDPHKLDVSVKRAFERQTLVRELSGLKEILNLYDATRVLSSIREEKELLQALAKHACEITRSDGASLLTISSDEKELTVAATHGARHGALLGQKIPFDRERVGRLNLDVLKTLESPEARKYFQLEQAPGFAFITSSLSVPVFYKERLLTILNLCRVENPVRPYKDEELRLITIFVAQAGYALENARLYESLHAQSTQLESVLSEWKKADKKPMA